jgi:uncharacterized protein (TIGR02996 family)
MAKEKPLYLEPVPPDAPRNAALERVILDNPDDKAGYLVYADWLTQQGDPRGELIVVQSEGKADREAELLATHPFMRGLGQTDRTHLQKAGPGIAKATWRWGFWEKLHIFNVIDWMDSKFPTKDVLDRLFTNPAALVLQELKVGVIRWEYNASDVKMLIEEAAKAPFAKTIKSLRFGEVDGIDIDCAHHPIGDLSGITNEAFPELRELTMWGCDIELGDLNLPKLQKLVVQTCGLSQGNVATIANGSLPVLDYLDIWFGSEDYGNDNTLESIEPILQSTNWPKLTHLGLMNCPFTDGICERLGTSTIIRQLSSLDLSMGTMTDDGARALLQHRGALAHLKTIDISQTYVTEGMVAELQSIGATIVANDMREDEDPDYRYVVVAE